MCKAYIEEIKKKNMPKTMENAISIANEMIEKLNITEMPVDITYILTRLGFKIYVIDDLKDNISGLIYVSPDLKDRFQTDKIIMLNERDKRGRQRFTLAHEFSHYIFDFNYNTMTEYVDTYDTNKSNNEDEKICSRFAAELLIPKKLFEKKVKELYEKGVDRYSFVEQLVDYFDVSVKSIRKRFDELSEDLPSDIKSFCSTI